MGNRRVHRYCIAGVKQLRANEFQLILKENSLGMDKQQIGTLFELIGHKAEELGIQDLTSAFVMYLAALSDLQSTLLR